MRGVRDHFLVEGLPLQIGTPSAWAERACSRLAAAEQRSTEASGLFPTSLFSRIATPYGSSLSFTSGTFSLPSFPCQPDWVPPLEGVFGNLSTSVNEGPCLIG